MRGKAQTFVVSEVSALAFKLFIRFFYPVITYTVGRRLSHNDY